MTSNKANRLIHESSPYLLQHAYNPVDWYPWGEEAISLAKKENKPIMVSIGYSSCHWCHVMEKESFEDPEIAKLMNQHFICIKVDREERPDIDQIYMNAVQTMGLAGGWPLNVFLTPDQKPFYGGTYFPNKGWAELLQNVQAAYKQNRDKLEESAEKFTEALQLSETSRYNLHTKSKKFSKEVLDQIYQTISPKIDNLKGGMDKAPKFPMPCIWQFLLKYYHISADEKCKQEVKITLDHMARGGIYDQIGGGFARYSVDNNWHVPHFEKMLYDNGQLISLYSEAYSLSKEVQYKEIVYGTIDFIDREMSNGEGGFYSALDADSEGEEGKFYVWHKNELQSLFGDLSTLIGDYYNVRAKGNWENEKNLLHKRMSDENFAGKHKIELSELKETIREAKQVMLEARNTRPRPGLDDKILTSWNAIMLKGLVDAYAAFGEAKFLQLALKNAQFIDQKLTNKKGLYRTYKNGKASLKAYLEDYALVIQAYISLYQLTFHEYWLDKARELTDYALENFYDPKEELFFYTDQQAETLIARKKEIFDNVIPASNSVMATNLYLLSHLLGEEKYYSTASNMLAKITPLLKVEGQYLANWAALFTLFVQPTAEIAIYGPKAEEFMKEISTHFWPNKVMMGCRKESNLPLLKDKNTIDDKTTIFLCYEKSCKRPVFTVSELLKDLKKSKLIND
ncbi:thioredoxin domain-containing protein [Xanthovirga aplysinae]|uniref:thioredoxin domain-containing protein n=1 Tax=Xanthovirga aplysinae TaxID=2529853 RepID=UPI0012BC82C7|nr:thioredoxin domain-containing protein [Xanthovirga aplysinae]MTI30830.1 thioredoxin domain-containing protein [Xanthovirga aplysinae]